MHCPIWYLSCFSAATSRYWFEDRIGEGRFPDVLVPVLDRQKKWGEQPKWDYDQLMVKYLRETETQKRSAARDRDIAKHLTREFRGRVLSSLCATDIKAYIEMRRKDKAMNSTIHRELSLLSAAINYARREWDWEIPNPVSGRKPGQGEGRVRWITHDEAAKLLAAASTEPRSPHLPDVLRLGLNTGCRSQEMLGLESAQRAISGGGVGREGLLGSDRAVSSPGHDLVTCHCELWLTVRAKSLLNMVAMGGLEPPTSAL